MFEHTKTGQLTRRRILGLSLTAAALAPIVAACGAPATPTAAPKPTEAPKAAAPAATTAPAAAATTAPAAKPTEAPKPTAAAAAAKPTEAPKPTAAAGATAKPATAGGAFDWMKFKGDSINVEMSTSPRSDMFKKYQKEFEDLTGIKVNLEITPEQQARQKQVIQFQAGATDFDVTFVSLARPEATLRQEQVDPGPQALGDRHEQDPRRVRLRGHRQGRRRLRDPGRWPHGHHADDHRPLDGLLEQGALRQGRPEVPDQPRRDVRRRPRS